MKCQKEGRSCQNFELQITITIQQKYHSTILLKQKNHSTIQDKVPYKLTRKTKVPYKLNRKIIVPYKLLINSIEPYYSNILLSRCDFLTRTRTTCSSCGDEALSTSSSLAGIIACEDSGTSSLSWTPACEDSATSLGNQPLVEFFLGFRFLL